MTGHFVLLQLRRFTTSYLFDQFVLFIYFDIFNKPYTDMKWNQIKNTNTSLLSLICVLNRPLFHQWFSFMVNAATWGCWGKTFCSSVLPHFWTPATIKAGKQRRRAWSPRFREKKSEDDCIKYDIWGKTFCSSVLPHFWTPATIKAGKQRRRALSSRFRVKEKKYKCENCNGKY